MSKWTLDWDYAAAGKILKNDVKDLLEERAREIAARAEGDYSVSVYTGRNRANASVYTTDEATYQDNLENNTLLKAVR